MLWPAMLMVIFYAGGEFDTIGEVRALNIARWDGEKWDSLGPGFTNLSTNDCYVENIVFDSYGNVYVSGSFTNAGDVEINNIAKWDGVRWSSLGDGLPIHVNSIVCDSSGNVFAAGRKDSIFKWDGEKWNRFANIKGTVYSLKIDKQNKLYVCGEFTMNESINAKSIAIWDGSVWSSPYPIDASNYMRYLAVDNSGNICTGGYLFEKVHDTDASNIIKWDGTSWRALGQRVWAVTNSNKKHVINDVLVVNENEIYVGGLSNFGYPSSLFSRWDGENWKILEPPSIDGLTQAICRDRFGNIYIAGELEKSLDKKYGNIVKWDGSNWHTLGTGTNGKIFALAADNKGNLYAGGAFDSAGGEIATCVAVWDGDKWSRLKAGMYNKNDTVFALACDKKGRLFAGGKFSFAGEATANCIAMWDGKVWNSLGSGLGENNKAAVYALAFDENDNLYVAGSFSTAGGLSAQNLAFWDGVQWHPMKSYMNYRINAIVCDKMGNVYVGHESDNKMSSLWKWDGNEWSSLGFGTRNGVVRALAIYDSSLYAGGTFQTAGNHYSPLFAKVNIHTMGVTKNLPELASDAIPKLSFYMQKSTLFFRNIDREDIISIYSLSGRLLRRYRGVSEIKLQEMGRQPFVLCVRRSGVDLVRSIMVKM